MQLSTVRQQQCALQLFTRVTAAVCNATVLHCDKPTAVGNATLQQGTNLQIVAVCNVIVLRSNNAQTAACNALLQERTYAVAVGNAQQHSVLVDACSDRPH